MNEPESLADEADLVTREVREMASGRVAVLTLNRPAQRNPLDRDTAAELNRQMDALLADPSMRAVILTGAPPAFSAGGDLRGYLELYNDEARFSAFLGSIRMLFDRLESSRLISIAAINGACVAGGFEMALACDLVVASRNARIGDGHLRFWQLPGGGGSQRLPRAVGFALAKRLFYTHELLGAEELMALGLICAVVDESQLIEEAVRLAERATAAPETTITTMKRLLRTAESETLEAGLADEITTVVEYTSTPDGAAYQGLLQFTDPDRKR